MNPSIKTHADAPAMWWQLLVCQKRISKKKNWKSHQKVVAGCRYLLLWIRGLQIMWIFLNLVYNFQIVIHNAQLKCVKDRGTLRCKGCRAPVRLCDKYNLCTSKIFRPYLIKPALWFIGGIHIKAPLNWIYYLCPWKKQKGCHH